MRAALNKQGPTRLSLLGKAQDYIRRLRSANGRLSDSYSGQHAWEEFFTTYDQLIRRFVAKHGIDPSDFEDCVQDVWTEISGRLTDFTRPELRPGLRSWLFSVARSKAVNYLRERRRCASRSLDRDQIESVDEGLGPSSLLERESTNEIVQAALQQLERELSPLNRAIFKLRIVERRSVDQVTKQLGIKPEHVYCRQHRIMKRLRGILAPVEH